MKDHLTLEILTPEKKLIEAQATSIRVRLSDGGSMGILPGHAKLIAATAPGGLSYVNQSNQQILLKLDGGILIIQDNLVRVMTNTLLEDREVEKENPLDRITHEIMAALKAISVDA